MVIECTHLTASRFFGGPERQMIELACELRPNVRSTFLSFFESGLCGTFLEKARQYGFGAHKIRHDTPYLVAALRELKGLLASIRAEILVCHGYKANLIGLLAARSINIPIVAVSRGWTGQCRRVRLYETLDRRVLRRVDRVVCVSEGQAQKVRRAGVAEQRIAVIHNAIRVERFSRPRDLRIRRNLQGLFATHQPTHILGAAGRLSAEKGFDILVKACHILAADARLDFGLAIFGVGDLHDSLRSQINGLGLCDRVVLAGFTEVLDQYMPDFDIFVQSSYTEGLPNVLLEAAAAGVPVVATDVGGTAEVVVDGKTGLLVAPGDPAALASVLRRLLVDASTRHAMGEAAAPHVAAHFTFAKQAEQYWSLFTRLLDRNGCVYS